LRRNFSISYLKHYTLEEIRMKATKKIFNSLSTAAKIALFATLGSAAFSNAQAQVAPNATIRLSVSNGQTINLNQQRNGGIINSWSENANDQDQQFVFESTGGNCGYLRRTGTNYVISVKSANSGTDLEAWVKVPGAWQQVFCFQTGKQPGSYYLGLQRNGELVINIPLSQHNTKIKLWSKNYGDKDQEFFIKGVGGQAPNINTPAPNKGRSVLLTGACSSFTQSCLPDGYNGYDNTWSFGASGKNNDGTWHNCTAFAAWWLQLNGQRHPGVNLGNAKTWGVRAQSAGMDVRYQPVVGSVGVVESGEFGHVFIVSQINGDGTMWIMEDNFSWTRGYSSRRKVSTDYGTKFIVPPAYR
jgi:surface antigen